MTITRRATLGGIVASTAVLAGCGQVSDAQPTEPTTDMPSGEVMLGLVSEVKVGTGTKFAVNEMLTVLVTQPKAGEFKAFSATCTHAGCIVQGVEGNEIYCGCHGARFDYESGMVTSGPAKSALGKIPVEIRGEEIWVTI
jgi:nitrite reductase/ring-hydroxylating ferredoxin subunit